jgi:imidazolonepropionase-like amidohydrolase
MVWEADMRSAAGKFAHFLSFSLLLSCSASSQTADIRQPPQQRVAIRAARMLDVTTGKIVMDPVVIVEGERIVSVGTGAAIPKDIRVIDLGDSTLLPGLIDAHTHITYHFDQNGLFGFSRDAGPEEALKASEENARRTLEAGFTTIRNLGDPEGVDIRLRDLIKSGDAVGPRMIVSGQPLTPDILGYTTRKPERLELMRRFVRARIAEGVDVIKIFEGVDEYNQPLLSPEEVRAAVEVAKAAGLKVAVHAHEAPAVIAAIKGGCDSIEHGTFLNDEAISLLAKNRVALVPTLYLPTHYIEHKKQFAFGPSTWTFFEDLRSKNLENLRKARSRGVWVVNGSDAVAGLHGQNAREPIWLTKAGMKPDEAIRAATLDAAELLGLKGQIGDIKEGFFADIIAVTGDPLKDIGALERVTFVMRSGKVVKSKL